jgi:hypothetical protein
MWLQWYAEQENENVKDEFIKQVELEKLITRVSPRVQLEILEFAPVDIKYRVQDSIHTHYKDKILWNIDEYEPEIPWREIFEKVCAKGKT